jgi:hypothetical protein
MQSELNLFFFLMATDSPTAEGDISIKLHIVRDEPLSELDAGLEGWPGAYCNRFKCSCISASLQLKYS